MHTFIFYVHHKTLGPMLISRRAYTRSEAIAWAEACPDFSKVENRGMVVMDYSD